MRKPKDWGQPCPHPECTHSRRMRQGNVSAIATYLTQSGKRRLFRCHTCAAHFAETRETVFCDLRTSEEKIMMALKMLRVRVDLAGIGCVLGVTAEPVLAWLRRAAHQAEALHQHLLRHLPVSQVQLDEMWTFVERQHARETDEAGESLPNGEDGRQGVWVSFAPRVLVAKRGCCGAARPRHSAGGRCGHNGTGHGALGVLQRRMHGVSGGAHRRLPHRDDVCAPWQAGTPTPACL